MKFKRLAACLLAAAMAVGSAAVPVVGTTVYAASKYATDMLSAIEYIGDRSKCEMDAEMANAYADTLERLPQNKDGYSLHAALIDPSSGGYPVLYTVYMDSQRTYIEDSVWTYNNGIVRQYDFEQEIFQEAFEGYYRVLSVVSSKNGTMLCVSSPDMYAPEEPGAYHRNIYQVYNAQLQLKHRIGVDGVISGMTGSLEINYYLDGEYVENYTKITSVLGLSENQTITKNNFKTGRPEVVASVTNVMDAISVLCDYASAVEGYNYPEASEVDDAALVKAIADAVAANVDGEIAGIYKLADGIYYVIIIVGDVEKGALVCGSKTDGKITWNVVEVHDERVSQDELDKILSDLLKESNVELDYSKLSGAKTEDVVTYIQSQIDNMNGITPNDAAKAELAEYIESAISSSCGVAVKGKDNRLTLKSKDVATLAEQALAEKQQYEELLKANDIELNKKLVIMVRILWQNMDNGSPCQITLDQDLLDALGGCDIQIILTDAQHYVQLSSKNLQKLIDKYGEVQIQMAKDGESTYTINFLDKQGNTVEKLVVPVTFGLPALSELSTVMASYGDTNANWGGQFDPNTMSLAFDVSFSGRYEIIENKLDIADIKDLSEESQKAISFMVSKGYMGLVDELFHPEDPLTRYEFAQALVGMFFALDPALKTNFADVPADSQYYSYVASGEAKEIIQGFSATEFGGDRNMTVEQMLAFAARTLIDSKGYAEPADADSYLTSFSDGDEVSDWAKAQVALAIREGLIDRGGELNPGEEVTREQAAVILYRLFLLLYEVPKVELELPPTTGMSSGAIAAVGAGVVVVGGAAVVMLKKKKK